MMHQGVAAALPLALLSSTGLVLESEVKFKGKVWAHPP